MCSADFALEVLERRVLLSTVLWTGLGDGINWTDPANWSTNSLPGPADDVIIDVPANPTVRLTTGTDSVNSVTIRETFEITNATLEIASASTVESVFTFSGGTLSGTGMVTISNSLSWTGGTMTGGGTTTIPAGATGTLSTGSNKSLMDRTINVGGTVNHTAGTFLFSLSGAGTGTVNVLPGAVYNAVDGVNITHNFSGGTNTFNNQGTFTKGGTGTTTIGAQVTFNNTGTVNVSGGDTECSRSNEHLRPGLPDGGGI